MVLGPRRVHSARGPDHLRFRPLASPRPSGSPIGKVRQSSRRRPAPPRPLSLNSQWTQFRLQGIIAPSNHYFGFRNLLDVYSQGGRMSISPNVPTPQEAHQYENTGTPRWIAILFAILFLGVGALAYVGHTGQSELQTDLGKAQDQNKLLSAELDQANSRIADLKAHLEVTEQKVHLTEAEISN